jgi:hypothetical protein
MADQRTVLAAELFKRAVERPVERRSAFLNEACGEDVELRREVEWPERKEAKTRLVFYGVPLSGMLARCSAAAPKTRPKRSAVIESSCPR